MPKLHLYIGFEQVSQVHHTDSHRSQNHQDIRTKNVHSSSHVKRNALFKSQAISKQTLHLSQQFLKLGNKQQTHWFNGLLTTFIFYPTENSSYFTGYLNSLTMVDPFAMKSQIPSLFLWEEMKKETVTRFFWFHQAPHLSRHSIDPLRKCLEIYACGPLLASSGWGQECWTSWGGRQVHKMK